MKNAADKISAAKASSRIWGLSLGPSTVPSTEVDTPTAPKPRPWAHRTCPARVRTSKPITELIPTMTKLAVPARCGSSPSR
jgi:hypothetical protein